MSARTRWATGALALAWLLVVGWTGYEVVLTRLSRSDNSWVMPDMAVLVALLLLTVGAAAGSGDRPVVRRQVVGGLAVALALLVAVIWAVVAPLPQLRSVPLPPSTASPEQVVRTFVAALDAHDQGTARALCVRGTPPCGSLDAYVRVGIAQLGAVPPIPLGGQAGAKRVYVPVDLTGRTRSGERPGEDGVWGYVLSPVGPQGAWRIVDEGAV